MVQCEALHHIRDSVLKVEVKTGGKRLCGKDPY